MPLAARDIVIRPSVRVRPSARVREAENLGRVVQQPNPTRPLWPPRSNYIVSQFESTFGTPASPLLSPPLSSSPPSFPSSSPPPPPPILVGRAWHSGHAAGDAQRHHRRRRHRANRPGVKWSVKRLDGPLLASRLLRCDSRVADRLFAPKSAGITRSEGGEGRLRSTVTELARSLVMGITGSTGLTSLL